MSRKKANKLKSNFVTFAALVRYELHQLISPKKLIYAFHVHSNVEVHISPYMVSMLLLLRFEDESL